jgi:CheY-like chemotaxis protein
MINPTRGCARAAAHERPGNSNTSQNSPCIPSVIQESAAALRLIRTEIADFLRDCGYRVIEGAVAGDDWTVSDAQVTLDVVFSDVHLAGETDGFAPARRLRQTRPDIDIILTSGVWFIDMGEGGNSVPSAVRPGRPGKTLLIVEADLWTRYSAAEYFRAKGFRVIEARCADEAISLLSAEKPVDVVFSDTNAIEPVSTLSLTDWIARRHPTLPLLLTGTDSGSSAATRFAASPRGFIAKPYLLAEAERQIIGLM